MHVSINYFYANIFQKMRQDYIINCASQLVFSDTGVPCSVFLSCYGDRERSDMQKLSQQEKQRQVPQCQSVLKKAVSLNLYHIISF